MTSKKTGMRKQIILIVLSAVLIVSCSKEIKLDQLSFDVTATKTLLAPGDTAGFNFSGNPYMITFYSGEVGSRYELRNRTTDTSTDLRLKFSTATTTATNGSLALLVSNNFSGAINAANIATATWTDITNRAVLATGTATVASGTVSLTDFAKQGKPVYIAFRYTAAAGAIQKNGQLPA